MAFSEVFGKFDAEKIKDSDPISGIALFAKLVELTEIPASICQMLLKSAESAHFNVLVVLRNAQNPVKTSTRSSGTPERCNFEPKTSTLASRRHRLHYNVYPLSQTGNMNSSTV